MCSSVGKGSSLALFLEKMARMFIVVGLTNQEVRWEEQENKGCLLEGAVSDLDLVVNKEEWRIEQHLRGKNCRSR